MKKTVKKPKKRVVAAAICFVLILCFAAMFFFYVSDYYRAEEKAKTLQKQETEIRQEDNMTILSAFQPTDTAIIFYPGAKVETEAYLPLLDRIRKTGVDCILIDMPFHMAIFDVDAADEVIKEFPNIEHWYMAGHSMGGAMASQYAADHRNKIDGLILFGAYIYGDYSPEDTLTIYGSLDKEAERHIDYSENVVVIPGGNHAQFGNYGLQKGDPPAKISSEEQQKTAVQSVEAFLEERF